MIRRFVLIVIWSIGFGFLGGVVSGMYAYASTRARLGHGADASQLPQKYEYMQYVPQLAAAVGFLLAAAGVLPGTRRR